MRTTLVVLGIIVWLAVWCLMMLGLLSCQLAVPLAIDGAVIGYTYGSKPPAAPLPILEIKCVKNNCSGQWPDYWPATGPKMEIVMPDNFTKREGER